MIFIVFSLNAINASNKNEHGDRSTDGANAENGLYADTSLKFVAIVRNVFIRVFFFSTSNTPYSCRSVFVILGDTSISGGVHPRPPDGNFIARRVSNALKSYNLFGMFFSWSIMEISFPSSVTRRTRTRKVFPKAKEN